LVVCPSVCPSVCLYRCFALRLVWPSCCAAAGCRCSRSFGSNSLRPFLLSFLSSPFFYRHSGEKRQNTARIIQPTSPPPFHIIPTATATQRQRKTRQRRRRRRLRRHPHVPPSAGRPEARRKSQGPLSSIPTNQSTHQSIGILGCLLLLLHGRGLRCLW
jgi:hypothetical protein